jgi:hypothetical protein
MRTREARRNRDRAIRTAKKNGHNVALISKSGAVELYGCLHQKCNDTMDCWDAPAIVNGELAHRRCEVGWQSPSFRDRIKIILTWVRDFFFRRGHK